MSNVGPFLVRCITSQSADEYIGLVVDCRGFSYLSGILIGQGTTSSGVVTLEQAFYDPLKQPAYTGTWSPITTLNASDVTGGQQKVCQLPVADYGFVRPRITTVIGGGGTISFDLSGH